MNNDRRAHRARPAVAMLFVAASFAPRPQRRPGDERPLPAPRLRLAARAPWRRLPWTGSKSCRHARAAAAVHRRVAFPHLKFEFPVVLVPAKGTDRLFLGDLRGRIFSFPNDPGCARQTSCSTSPSFTPT